MKKRDLEEWEKAECLALKAAVDAFNAGKARKDSLTQGKIAEALGINQGSVSSYLNGYNALNAKVVSVIAGLISKPVESFSPRLAKEISEMAKASSVATDNNEEFPRTPSDDDYALIQHISAVGECGRGHLNGHIEVKGSHAFPRTLLARMGVKAEHCRICSAEGASMEPYIFEDDMVLIDTSDVIPRDRVPYAIRRADGGISFKRLIQQLSGTWLLRSDNPDKNMYPDEPVSAMALHDIPIIGRIVWRGGEM